jgi:hypothetical protein
MPSVGEIFNVTGVAVGTGVKVKVDSEVAVNGISVGIGVSDGIGGVVVGNGVVTL